MLTRLTAAASSLVLALIVTGCASTGAVPRPFPTPGGGTAGAAGAPATPSAVLPAPPDALDRDDLVETALSLRGVPYRNGGSDATGFDCSGFTQYVFAKFGLPLPREVHEQFGAGTNVKRDGLEPGDLLFFSTTAKGASHVGIAVGGDRFVHAPSSTGTVRVESLKSSYWSRRFVGARRISELRN